jgi:hypothetical protein
MSGMPDTVGDVTARLNYARNVFRRRDALVGLMDEIYAMSRARKTGYLSDDSSWRNKVHGEYWSASPRGHNTVDIATAVLGGYPPQYSVTCPGGSTETSKVASRAEIFLAGLWRANSRRQEQNLYNLVAHNTVLHGSAAVKILWDHRAPDPVMETKEQEDGQYWAVATYPRNLVPITLSIIPIRNLYPIGPSTFDSPFSELVQVENRTYSSVVREWRDIEGAVIPPPPINQKVNEPLPPVEDRVAPYIEWWGYDYDGSVNYMVTYDEHVVIPRKTLIYPFIPYVFSVYKQGMFDEVDMQKIPMLFPMIYSLERTEYLNSRIMRIVDMLSNLVPVHRGATPMNIEGAWGKILQMNDPNERVEFPQWPGNPPDVWKVRENLEKEMSESSFSEAMFGQTSARMSGYGLSQLIGADTLRMDTPRGNLELFYSKVGDMVFQMLQEFSYSTHIAVTTQVKGKSFSAMLAGRETEALVVDTFVKPKQASDEQRLAVVGAQLASLPKPPVSMRYILEHYFGIAQPEEEIQTVMEETAMRDPMVQLMALIDVLKEQKSPYLPIVEAQLGKVLMQQAGGAGSGAPSMPNIGMGLEQAMAGNEPMPQNDGSVTNETGMFSPENVRMGGPPPE